MRISPYSIIASIVLCSIYLSIICLIRKRFRLTKKSHVTTFYVLYLLGFVRLLLPIDFSFTKGIHIKGYFSEIWKILFGDRITIGMFEISIIDIMIGLIGVISCIRIIRFVHHYKKENDLFKILDKYDSEQIKIVLEEIERNISRMPSFSIVKCSFVNMPSVIGLFKKYIILPDLDFTNDELYFVLLHEIVHICRYDLVKKTLIGLFRCIFWWIPFSSFVAKDIEQMMEINCDRTVFEYLSEQEKSSYMRTILNCLRRATICKSSKIASLAFALKENQEAVLERFKIMTSMNNSSIMSRAIILLVLIILVFTYLFVPFPYYVREVEGMEGTIVTNENTYMIYENGIYFLVLNDATKIEIKVEHVQNMIEESIPLLEE